MRSIERSAKWPDPAMPKLAKTENGSPSSRSFSAYSPGKAKIPRSPLVRQSQSGAPRRPCEGCSNDRIILEVQRFGRTRPGRLEFLRQEFPPFCRAYPPATNFAAAPADLPAPGFQFHAATEIVQKYFSSEIHITRIGLNENWRRGLRVIFRQ